MGLLARVLEGSATRSTLADPEEWLRTALTGGETFAGKAVSVASSMKLVPIFSAVTLLSGAVGSLPLPVYVRDGRRRVRATGTRAWELLHDEPNPEMAADEVFELVASHLATWGNAYLWKQRAGDGRIGALWPLNPSRFQVGRQDDGERIFVIDGNLGDPFTEEDILHIRGLSSDGMLGYSPIQQARQTIAGALAQEEFQGRFWANDATPGVVLKHPNSLSDAAAKRLKATWNAAHRGPARARETAILEEAMDVEQMTMPLKDAQFVEQAEMTRTDISLLFRVPPHFLAAKSGDSLTYATSEGQSLDFVKWSLRRWLVRIERSIGRDPDILPSNHYAEFLIDGLLRAATKERFEAYATADFMTVNEKRERENLDPIDGGDELDQGGTDGA